VYECLRRAEPVELGGDNSRGGSAQEATAIMVEHFQAFRNVSRSALMVSASVVGMPCGKPL